MAARLEFNPFLEQVVSHKCSSRFVCALWDAVLDYGRYVFRELSDRCTAEFEYHPATRKVLLFGVSYPLGRVLVSICSGSHFVAGNLSFRQANWLCKCMRDFSEIIGEVTTVRL